MSLIIRFCVSSGLSMIGVLAVSSPATAQFRGGGGLGFRSPMFMNAPMFMNPRMPLHGGFSPLGLRPIPSSLARGMSPYRAVNPLPAVNSYNPPSRNYNTSYPYLTPYYYLNMYSQPGYSAAYPSLYGGMSGYAAGSSYGPGVQAASNALGLAQRQGALETNPLGSQPGGNERAIDPQGHPAQDAPVLAKTLVATDASAVASGEALNLLLAAAIAAEGKGGKGEAAYLPPDLLDAVRFAGSPTAEALDLLHHRTTLNLPAAFQTPAFAAVGADLKQSLAGAVAPILAGKPADSGKVATLATTVTAARIVLEPGIKNLDFEDATSVRRVLNQLDATVTLLKGTGKTNLIDPKWRTEGTDVADLVKYMTKYSIRFGPVQKGHEDAYLALHRGLAIYLLTLRETAPQKK